MSDAPERIWATEDAENYGEDRFHSKTSFPGGTEYVRADIADAAHAAGWNAAMEAAAKKVDDYADWSRGWGEAEIYARRR